MQSGRGLAGAVGVGVIGVVALVYFGLDGTEREKAPPEILDTRGAEAVDPSSPAEAGSSRAVAEQLATDDRTGEAAPADGEVSAADRAAIEAFLRAAGEALQAGSEAANRDVAPVTPGRRNDEIYLGQGGASRPTLEDVSVRSHVTISCANSPTICNYFSSTSGTMPGALSVVANGTEAVLLPMPGEPDVVYIRTRGGFILARTENLTNAGQLAALVERLAPRP